MMLLVLSYPRALVADQWVKHVPADLAVPDSSSS